MISRFFDEFEGLGELFYIVVFVVVFLPLSSFSLRRRRSSSFSFSKKLFHSLSFSLLPISQKTRRRAQHADRQGHARHGRVPRAPRQAPRAVGRDRQKPLGAVLRVLQVAAGAEPRRGRRCQGGRLDLFFLERRRGRRRGRGRGGRRRQRRRRRRRRQRRHSSSSPSPPPPPPHHNLRHAAVEGGDRGNPLRPSRRGGGGHR